MPALNTLPSLLLPSIATSLLLGVFSGFHLADGRAPLLGLLLALVALGLLVHALWSLQRRITAVVEQSTRALRELGEGRSAFRLDAHRLAGFDPLLLAIDDLREVVEPRHESGAVSAGHA